jgi:hypothetical protein
MARSQKADAQAGRYKDEQLHRWTDEQVKIFLKVFYQFYQTILKFRAFKSHEKIRQ